MDPVAAPKLEPSGVGSFLTWLEVNRNRVLVIGVSVVVVTLVIVLYLRHESERESRASFALSEVRTSVNPATPPPPGAVDNFLKVASDYPGSQAAPRALLMAASALFVEGKYAESQKVFERTMREYQGNPWAAQASLGIAKSVDAQKNIPEAITRYEDVRKRFANTSAADEATIGVARMYELEGKNEQAIRLYHDLSQSSSSSIGARAGFRKEALIEKFPQLTNAIAPIMATPTAMQPPGNPMMGTNLSALRSNLTRANLRTPGGVANPQAPSSGVPWRPPETDPRTPTPGAPNVVPAPTVKPAEIQSIPGSSKPAEPKVEGSTPAPTPAPPTDSPKPADAPKPAPAPGANPS